MLCIVVLCVVLHCAAGHCSAPDGAPRASPRTHNGSVAAHSIALQCAAMYTTVLCCAVLQFDLAQSTHRDTDFYCVGLRCFPLGFIVQFTERTVQCSLCRTVQYSEVCYSTVLYSTVD